MRILFVSHTFPWPARNGAQIRLTALLRTLAHVGEVDLFSIVSPSDMREVDARALGRNESVVRVGMAARPSGSYRISRRLWWMAASRLPYELAVRDYSAVRSTFQSWARPAYDLAWMEHAETYVTLGDLVDAPCIVDLDDLEDQKTYGRLRARADHRRSQPWTQRVAPGALARWWGSSLQGAVDARRWRNLQEQVSRSVASVAVCSSLDRDRLGGPNTVVLPNGYTKPSRALGRLAVGDPPTLMLAGEFTYTPNADAAGYFVREIFPRVRARFPRVQMRLVGNCDSRIEDLRSEDVHLTGRVRDIGEELAKADLIVVPLRFGGGTRIKILEAFAHRIPVVSTSFGCEGLEAIDGRHLLVANDAESFTAACAKLLTDVPLRARLADAGHQLYVRRYGWDVIAPAVVGLARGVVSGKTDGSSFSTRDPLGDDVAEGGKRSRPTDRVRHAPFDGNAASPSEATTGSQRTPPKGLASHSEVDRSEGALRVGAVVLHHRFWPGIAETLNALLSQTRPPNAVIVVDNHSGDDSLPRLRMAFPQLEVIENETNGGYAAGMNRGIEELQRRDSDAVLLLTHECHLAPNALEALVARLQEAPAVAAVGPLLGFLSAPELVFSAGGEVDPKWGTWHHRRPSMMGEWVGAPPSRVECLDGAALLLRMAAVRQAGRMDERYFMYFEETEYLLKLQRLGWAVECVPQAVGWQEPATKSLLLWDRNRLRFLARNASKAALARELARLLRDVVRDLRSPAPDEARALARARVWGLLYFLTRRWGPVHE